MMDSHGFYERHPCRNCGNMLQGEGDGTPAETYAGTYTGLCYRCSQLDKIIMKTSTLDGAMHISYAPLQPSWRRDRTRNIGYSDCSICHGDGRIYDGYSNWSKHYKSCQVCSDRYNAESHRAAYWEESLQLGEMLRTAANNAYVRDIEKRYGEYLKITPKRTKVKGKGRTKMFHRKRSVGWIPSILEGTPDDVRTAINNIAQVYLALYETKKRILDIRMAARHAVALNDMRVDHPLA